jgi:hypothetical protein
VRIKLPRDLRGTVFPPILSIELNDFDIDAFLPALFFTILASGKGRARRANDPTKIAHYINELAQHPALEGFQDEVGHRVLDRLTRTSLIVKGSVGRAKRGEQILATVPYTLLAHKPGFPAEGSRQRGADKFIYEILRDLLGTDERLREMIKIYFGKGVTIGNQPFLGGTYDGTTELDTLTRLSIAFLDVFQSVSVGGSRTRTAPPSCPALAREFATDMLKYLNLYYARMPVQALIYYLQALINFELFIYTLKLVHAINALVAQPTELPTAMQETSLPSPPPVYVDFTGNQRGLSREMASACLRRDVEAYQQFLGSNLLLRLLDHYVDQLRRSPGRRADLVRLLPDPPEGPAYLQGLLLLQRDTVFGPELQASARSDETRIRNENRNQDDGDEESSAAGFTDGATEADSDIERVVALLVEAQRQNALSSYLRWFSGVGGLTKPHGILGGSVGNRQSWRYAPRNDLLAVLVQLAAARAATPQSATASQRGPTAIRLRDFLLFLEERFGIVVDRPPAPFAGPDYSAAARENLSAMLSRLRQMGIFRDLSDDFTVQSLTPPYMNGVAERRSNS